MIGLSILAVVFGYIFLAKFIVTKVYEKTKSIQKKNIAIAIMILIPTWDVILGFPVYAYLCIFESGVKIYKTVDNVEGFYIGEKSISSEPIEPYEGYRYIDYQEVKNNKLTGKYYRSYWMDYFQNREMANICVYPLYPKSLHHPYTKSFNSGKCIVKEEIAEGEVSLWNASEQKNNETVLVPNYLTKWTVRIVNRNTNKPLSELITYYYGQGWVAFSFSSIVQYARWKHCSLQKTYKDMLFETLKSKNQEEK